MADYYYNTGNVLKGLAPALNAVAGVGLGNAGYDLADMRTKFETAGNRIFLHRGAVQQVNALYFNSGLLLGNGNGVNIRLYGDFDAERSYVTTLWYVSPTDNGWVYIGAGRWTYTFPSSSAGTRNVYGITDIWRGVRFGDYPSQFLGRATLRYANANDVTSEGRYHFVQGVPDVSGMVLTMFTGSSTVHPGAYFGGLAINGTATGTSFGVINGVWQQNCRHCSVQGIALMGGSWKFNPTNAGGYAGSNVDNEYLQCESYAGYNHLQIDNQHSSVGNFRLSFDDWISDSLTGPEGNSVGFDEDEIATMDGVSINGYAEALRFRNITANAQRHSCFQAVPNSARAPDLTYPRGISVDGIKIDLRHNAYGRAFAMNCDGWTVTNATVKNQTVQSQLSGIGHLSRFTFDCEPYGFGQPGQPDYTLTNGGVDHCLGFAVNGSGATLSTVKNVKVSFGTIRNPSNYALKFENLLTQVVEISNVTFESTNASFTNRRYANQPSNVPIANPNGMIVMYNSNAGSAIDPQIIRNCAHLVPAGQEANIVVFDTNVTWTLAWTQYGPNALAGHTGNAVYTSLSAAGLDKNLRPLTTSPLLLAGNITSTGHRDADSNEIPVGVALPIGAYSGLPLRSSAL